MKDFKEPLLILLVLFVLFGLAYSPLKNAALRKNSTTSKNTNSSIGATTSNSKNSTNKSVAEQIKKTEASVKDLAQNVSEEIEKGQRSPFFGKVSMSGISGLRNNNPDREFITLSTKLQKGETLKITGWYLKSDVTGNYAIIGKAALLPFPFTKTESDVVIQSGDRVYLTKGFSPIGISFRTNKCTGYFEENRTFTPSLPISCPRPIDEKLPSFSNIYERSDECLKIIERISQCTTVDNEFIRDLPDTVTSSCKNYLTGQINYNTCVALHFGDTDFPGKQYRLYFGAFGPLWLKLHDTITLRDQNGLIVDSISY